MLKTKRFFDSYGKLERNLCRSLSLFLFLVGVISLQGCGGLLDVENPGVIAETALNDSLAIVPVRVGVAGDFAVAYAGGNGDEVLFSGLLAQELVHSGSFPTFREFSNGVILYDNIDLNNWWGRLQRARFVADDAARRIKTILTVPQQSSNLAEVRIYAGFARILLSDNFGAVPYDGGPLVPQQQVYQDAEANFTEALTIAQTIGNTTLAQRATAGRARARLMLGNTAGALADASTIPNGTATTGFRFDAIYSENSARENNLVVVYTITRLETSVAPAFRNTGDPRVVVLNLNRLGPDGATPVFQQRKYTSRASPVAITKWQEMALIRAEVKLGTGDVTGALTDINAVRSAAGLAAYANTNPDSVRARLRTERAYEFFLEGKRLVDLRRYNQIPAGRASFFPFPKNEIDTNPNVR